MGDHMYCFRLHRPVDHAGIPEPSIFCYCVPSTDTVFFRISAIE